MEKPTAIRSADGDHDSVIDITRPHAFDHHVISGNNTRVSLVRTAELSDATQHGYYNNL
jgi:hypothetical protein